MSAEELTLPLEPLYLALRAQGGSLAKWADDLPEQVSALLTPDAHGKMPEWSKAIAQLPTLERDELVVDLQNGVAVNTAVSLDQRAIEANLQALHPWRKGPFDLFGIHLDTEWRSDWKWARLADKITPLHGRVVLDVGSGNGYYGWRMVGAGAKLVVGLDPFLVYVMQYTAVQKLLQQGQNYVLPLGIEQLPPALAAFDTVFSMGVLYHRRDPFEHLLTLHDALRPGGELVLETLVIEGELGEVLVPEGRYAQMRNVWFIPSPPTLESWLRKAGFREVRLLDVTPTTTEEQRATPWMRFHSLTNFLDPDDPTRTIEGHPAPVRAIFTAQRSGG